MKSVNVGDFGPRICQIANRLHSADLWGAWKVQESKFGEAIIAYFVFGTMVHRQ